MQYVYRTMGHGTAIHAVPHNFLVYSRPSLRGSCALSATVLFATNTSLSQIATLRKLLIVCVPEFSARYGRMLITVAQVNAQVLCLSSNESS